MALSAASPALAHLNTALHRSHPSRHCHLTWNKKHMFPVIMEVQTIHHPLMMRSMLNRMESDITNGETGGTVPPGVLVKSLFSKAQKLEAVMDKDRNLCEDIELNVNLEDLELGLQAMLQDLIKKEEVLQVAEERVLIDQAELKHVKLILEQRGEEISSAHAKQKQMEEDLNKAYRDLASQSRHIEDLKLLVEEQEKKIAGSQSVCSQKEDELDTLRNELLKKNEKEAIMSSEINSQNQLLNEADDIIKEQELKIQNLQTEVRQKEDELAKLLQLRKDDEEKLKVMEINLEQRTMEWLSAREELKKLTKQASMHMNIMEEASEDIRRVRALLADVRSELVSSQKSLLSSHREIEDRTDQFEKQLAELDGKKRTLISFAQDLKDAQLEVEIERGRLQSVYAQHEDLKTQLSAEKKLIKQLQEDLIRERSSLRQGNQEIVLLQKELHQKEVEFGNYKNLLQLKEAELVQARLQIEHMKSEHVSLQLILKEKDTDISDALRKLANAKHEITEQRMLLNRKEDELIQATTLLQEKEQHISKMQHELNDTKHKFSEAASAVEQIAQLTNKLVISAKNKDNNILLQMNEASIMQQGANSRTSKKLETEIEMMRELLQRKERKLHDAQRALETKNKELLKSVCRRLDAKEKGLERVKEEFPEDAYGLNKLGGLAQERHGNTTSGDLENENLQIGTAQSEAEAAATALWKLVDLSYQLGEQVYASLFLCKGDGMLPVEDNAISYNTSMSLEKKIECLEKLEEEITRVFTLTEQLVKEAGYD